MIRQRKEQFYLVHCTVKYTDNEISHEIHRIFNDWLCYHKNKYFHCQQEYKLSSGSYMAYPTIVFNKQSNQRIYARSEYTQLYDIKDPQEYNPSVINILQRLYPFLSENGNVSYPQIIIIKDYYLFTPDRNDLFYHTDLKSNLSQCRTCYTQQEILNIINNQYDKSNFKLILENV